mmetsp:Transcript_36922/g.114034  ORF Transcript_36922/g.114034 Transcript_36922/m.114034 type:complete len:242 (-) Transcript_36922:18-743(-)
MRLERRRRRPLARGRLPSPCAAGRRRRFSRRWLRRHLLSWLLLKCERWDRGSGAPLRCRSRFCGWLRVSHRGLHCCRCCLWLLLRVITGGRGGRNHGCVGVSESNAALLFHSPGRVSGRSGHGAPCGGARRVPVVVVMMSVVIPTTNDSGAHRRGHGCLRRRRGDGAGRGGAGLRAVLLLEASEQLRDAVAVQVHDAVDVCDLLRGVRPVEAEEALPQRLVGHGHGAHVRGSLSLRRQPNQ